MSEISNFALLADLARIIKKHGPKAFSDLSALLRNPEKIEELATILEAGASAGQKAKVYRARTTSPSRRKSPAESLAPLFSRIVSTDSEKAELLSKFYEDLLARRVLPTLRQIREFARENRIRGAQAESREKAISPLIQDLSVLPRDQLISILRRMRPGQSLPDDRSLERWADVILDKNRSRDK